jgi:hypothetical protein
LPDLKAGDVFVWKNYPLADHKDKEQRWFLYLGKNIFDELVYEITTTTQERHYVAGGSRVTNNFFRLPAGMGGLDRESVVDITQYFEKVPLKVFVHDNEKMEVKGKLTQSFADILLSHIKIAKNIAAVVKKDIYRCFVDAGFKVKNN